MKKSTLTIFMILAGCMLLLSGIWIYFQKSLEQVDIDKNGKSAVYKKHYVLIADEKDSMLWQSVYESARAEAADANAYLELVQPGGDKELSQLDYLQISIASQVDGIILKPDGSAQMRRLIDEAVSGGIPVVTVLEDDAPSKRISFVGLNSYQMGDAYTEQILKYLKPDTTEIMVLTDSGTKDTGTSLVYSRMIKEVEQRKHQGQNVNISAYRVDSSTDFNSEEVIRDIFVNGETLPDIMICFDEVVTECTYQALVDYNEVGNVSIIGYYYSDLILDAVQKGTIPATIALDTEEIGKYSINALQEYYSSGYTSNYYSVGLNVITSENVSDFIESEAVQEGQ